MQYLRESLKEAGYKFIRKDIWHNGVYILMNQNGGLEYWVANKHFAGYAIKFRGTALEFMSNAPSTEAPF